MDYDTAMSYGLPRSKSERELMQPTLDQLAASTWPNELDRIAHINHGTRLSEPEYAFAYFEVRDYGYEPRTAVANAIAGR
jgi:hypothetical protein